MEIHTEHPWQQEPADLISIAIELMMRNSEAYRRVAFVLLDLGVETLFRDYLSLPVGVTGTRMPDAERRRAAGGNFPELLEAVSQASSGKLKGHALADVAACHRVRNTLYHEGDGITVTSDRLQRYAHIAVALLRDLLSVDLSDRLPRARGGNIGEETGVGKGKPGKYDPLRVHLQGVKGSDEVRITLSFGEIVGIISDSLPGGVYTDQHWWANAKGHVQAKSWLDAGWKADQVDLQSQRVSFRRTP
jgi:hypothetical protein